jgi:RimJ/RimL family protein N-acetyltransferase
MLTVDITYDYDLVQEIMSEPKLFQASMCDYDLSLGDKWEPDRQGWHYLLISLDEKPVGVIRSCYLTSTTIDSHGHILPEYWGTGLSDAAFKLGFDWYLANTDVHKIVVQTPRCCTHIIRAMHRIGWEVEGVLTKAIRWRGKLEDLVLMSLTIRNDKLNG